MATTCSLSTSPFSTISLAARWEAHGEGEEGEAEEEEGEEGEGERGKGRRRRGQGG